MSEFYVCRPGVDTLLVWTQPDIYRGRPRRKTSCLLLVKTLNSRSPTTELQILCLRRMCLISSSPLQNFMLEANVFDVGLTNNCNPRGRNFLVTGITNIALTSSSLLHFRITLGFTSRSEANSTNSTPQQHRHHSGQMVHS